jgi:predicted AAA+ superfamily ATPase
MFIDEIQKLPRLLDEVHRLIEEKKIRFLLTGSSAKKLRAGGANLLAGRARSLQLFPLTTQEIDDFDLQAYCNNGGLPLIYASSEPWADLRSYVQLYLREEIIAEAIVRKIDHYARFLDVIGLKSGEEINYQSLASDSGVPPRTVANFVEVLKDTLVAFELEPYSKTKKRKAVSKSKIYIFDVGVANYLAGRKNILLRSEAFGKAFEHFLIQEIRAYLSYRQINLPLCYWRTVVGHYEVDAVIGDELAIEIKASDKFDERWLTGLKELKAEKKVKRHFAISRDPIQRQVGGIEVMPYDLFLNRLWNDQLLDI